MCPPMKFKEQNYVQTNHALALLNPLNVMGRGFSYVTENSGSHKVIKSIKDIHEQEHLNLHLKDGEAKVKVQEVRKD